LTRPGQVPQRGDRVVGKIGAKLFLDGQIGIEQVERLLRKVAHLEARAKPDAPAVWRHMARHHLQQRGFARTVLSHHAPALATANGQVQPIVDDAATVSFRDALEYRDLLTRPWRRPEIEF